MAAVQRTAWRAQPKVTYRVDPDDPRAPPQDVWDQMSEEERERVVALLPVETPRQRALREVTAALNDMKQVRKDSRSAREEEQRRREEAEREPDEAKRKLAEVLAELERLKGR